jgi:hypothetical protein
MTSSAVGFQKLAFSPRLTGAAIGGTLGLAASPEDEGQAAGLTGAAMGYGAGALADHLHKRLTGPKPAKAPVPGPAGPPAAPGFAPEHMAEVENHLSGAHLTDQINAAAHKAGVTPGPAGYAPGEFMMPGNILTPERQKNLAKLVAPARARSRPLALPRTFGKVGFEKLSDYNMGVGVGPFGIGTSTKSERLDGMNRWVPRETIENAYQGLQQGLDQQALMEQAAESGNLQHPAVGAGLAAALAHFGLPGSSATGLPTGAKALAALAGGGLGALYNKATAGSRAADMAEAIKGVQREQRKDTHHTAREAMPLVVSGAGSNA